MQPIFDEYLTRWELTPDGAPMTTHTSHLLPVLYQGHPAMLKLSFAEEERRGAALMVWWRGEGAARVFAHSGNALLMERLHGEGSLAAMARRGRDDEATRIICDVAARLHAPRSHPAPELLPLPLWFRELEEGGERHGGILSQGAATARELLAGPRDIVVLHGDLHHENVLDGGERGWLAIDPKHLVGERGFDFANIFCNPDPSTAATPGRLARQVVVVAEAAALEPGRLLRWVLAWAALSAIWRLNSGETGEYLAMDLLIAEAAAAELASC